tara:strand:- start:2961 stop:4034 length:1074 start_codon:yes stop_codon:yes gene_type:complete
VDIYFFIGTKAQAIKCLPIIKELNNYENYRVHLVNSGQHIEIVQYILSEIENTVSMLNVFENEKNISTLKQSYSWLISFVLDHLVKRPQYRKDIKSGICFVHGDTVSTLLGLFWAKKNNLKVLHLESGLTSKKILKPFPEEAIRRIVSRFSDILVCFDDLAHNNLLTKFGDSDKLIKRISENSLLDSIIQNSYEINEKKVTVTLHRVENIISKKNLSNFINLLNKLNNECQITWYMHEPTRNYIKKHNIEIPELIKTSDLLEHKEFINEIATSSLIITDGGSIQEECFYLGKKTLIWRKETERKYALSSNMFISNLDVDSSINFINNNNETVNNNNIFENKPSIEIIKFLDTQIEKN